MEKAHFTIQINAPKEKVWDTMLGDATYREWTKPFNPSSYFEGNWEEGSVMRFLGTPEEGEGEGESGMVARVKENRLHEFLSLEHFGMMQKGVIDTTSEQVKEWTPAFENYTFTEVEGGTEVTVDVDVNEKYKTEFEAMWPKALDILKELSEAR